MLTMVALVGAVMIGVFVVAFCFYMMLSEQDRGQGKTDKMAMDLAKQLNDGDRVGQINNLIASNRELVYVSRQNVDFADSQHLPYFSVLANQLCDEARSSSILIEHERQEQIKLSVKQARDLALQHNLKTDEGHEVLSLPLWHTYDSQIFDVSLGNVKGVESNALYNDIYPDLRYHDERKKYFQKGSNLYIGGINAKLPEPDNDLNFHFAPLSAPVDSTVAPERMINLNAFSNGVTIFQDKKLVANSVVDIPTAAQVIQGMPVSALGTTNKQHVRIGSVAASPGANPPPK